MVERRARKRRGLDCRPAEIERDSKAPMSGRRESTSTSREETKHKNAAGSPTISVEYAPGAPFTCSEPDPSLGAEREREREEISF